MVLWLIAVRSALVPDEEAYPAARVAAGPTPRSRAGARVVHRRYVRIARLTGHERGPLAVGARTCAPPGRGAACRAGGARHRPG